MFLFRTYTSIITILFLYLLWSGLTFYTKLIKGKVRSINESINVTSDPLVAAACPVPKRNISTIHTNSAQLKMIYINFDTLKNKMKGLKTYYYL